jgi:hypothetical protein
MSYTEWIGYAASVLVAVSLLMSNVWKLRWINLVGSATFAVYGLLIHSWPVAIMNSICVGLNTFYLIQMSNRKDYFQYLVARNVHTAYIDHFLTYYAEDIKRFFPEFDAVRMDEKSNIILILRNAVPAGVFIYHKVNEHTARIDLDYTIPAYRDLKNTRYLLTKGLQERFIKQSLKQFVVHTTVPQHRRYLLRMGFVESADKTDCYLLKH